MDGVRGQVVAAAASTHEDGGNGGLRPGEREPKGGAASLNNSRGAAENRQIGKAASGIEARYQHVRTLEGHQSAVSGVKFKSDNGSLLASCSADGTIRIWETETGKALRTMQGHKNGLNDVSWSKDCQYLCSASDDKTAKVWAAETGQELSTLKGHSGYVFSVKFNPEGNLLVSGSFDETVRMWDARTSELVRELPAHSDPVTSVDINPDGTALVSSSFDGLVRIWDTSNGKCLKTLIVDNSEPVSFTRFTPNGKFLLVATLDGKMHLRDYEADKIKKTYKGYQNQRHCLVPAMSHTQGRHGYRWLVSGSEDNGIYVWEINKKKLCQKIEGRATPSSPGEGHCDVVLCVDTHPKQIMVASGAKERDCSIRLWRENGE
ncbi:unnamed protein product [Ostreobium quekettii]|uniref:WDR5-like beta-propeller domain-containing protein n=1 Tax=Ostreobium quekettii TaxID=121088 RepID=A0A8S1IM20_9CHLO|nr:unnamed protein product [Ostreobium quekettii]